jgi:thymidylate synthase ThyX
MKTAEIKVELLDSMGSDLTVANVARVSFDKKSEELDGRDVKLINYLATHDHWSPFAHCFAQFRIKAPIFVARQMVKHQVGLSWNEVSRRYVDSEPEVYIPEFWHGRADNVKQGSSEDRVKVNTYGTGICVKCGANVPRKTAGPRGKWCSDKCRASYRKEHDPDFRIHTAKYNAKARGLPFELTRGDVTWVTHCPILGIELDYNSTSADIDNAPSLDRIDSAKGYTADNTWVISNKANRMKNDADREELIQFARKILLHFNGQSVPNSSSIEDHVQSCIDKYNELLEIGVAPEEARMVLPLNTMTEWVWSGSLMAFARVCKQRLDPHAQRACREVAEQIDQRLRHLFPESMAALLDN